MFIAILKDVISREAIKRKVALNANVVMNDATITHVLNLIHPKMEYQIMLAKKVQLIDGLKDLQMQEDDLNFLAPEYQEIIEQVSWGLRVEVLIFRGVARSAAEVPRPFFMRLQLLV